MLNVYYLEREASQRQAELERRLLEAERVRSLGHAPGSRWRSWASAAGDVLIRLGQGLKQRVAVEREDAAAAWRPSAGSGPA